MAVAVWTPWPEAVEFTVQCERCAALDTVPTDWTHAPECSAGCGGRMKIVGCFLLAWAPHWERGEWISAEEIDRQYQDIDELYELHQEARP